MRLRKVAQGLALYYIFISVIAIMFEAIRMYSLCIVIKE